MKCITHKQMRAAYKAAMKEMQEESRPGRGDSVRLKRAGIHLLAYHLNQELELGGQLHAHGQAGGKHVRNERQVDTVNEKSPASFQTLLDACRFVVAFLDRLEAGLDADDPLANLRREYHAPLRQKLGTAIAKAEAEL